MNIRMQSIFIGSLVSLGLIVAACSDETSSGSTTTSTTTSSSDASSGSASSSSGGGQGGASSSTSSSGSSTGGSGQGGAGTGGAGTGGEGGAGGGNPGFTNGCTELTAQDMTAMAAVTITKGIGFNYTPPCVKVKANTKVTWSMDFVMHPLVGGTVAGLTKTPDPNSPIQKTNTGTMVTFALPNPGTYGFYCDVHAGAGMEGAVYVVP
jgi:plastocyanin